MDSTSFKETNFILRAGDNPNTNDIPACLCKDQVTGMDFIFAKFKLSPEELEQINRTGTIYVGVMGRNWPPLLPTVYNPFTDYEQCYIPYDLT